MYKTLWSTLERKSDIDETGRAEFCLFFSISVLHFIQINCKTHNKPLITGEWTIS